MIPHCICLILRFFPFALGVYDILSNWSCQSHDPSRISFLFEKNICRKDCSIHGIAMVWSYKRSGWGGHSWNGNGKFATSSLKISATFSTFSFKLIKTSFVFFNCRFSYAGNWKLVKSIVETKFRRGHICLHSQAGNRLWQLMALLTCG